MDSEAVFVDPIVIARAMMQISTPALRLSLAEEVYPAGGQSRSRFWVTNRTSVPSQSPWLKNHSYDDCKVSSSSIVVLGVFRASPSKRSSSSASLISSLPRCSSHGRQQGLFPSQQGVPAILSAITVLALSPKFSYSRLSTID